MQYGPPSIHCGHIVQNISDRRNLASQVFQRASFIGKYGSKLWGRFPSLQDFDERRGGVGGRLDSVRTLPREALVETTSVSGTASGSLKTAVVEISAAGPGIDLTEVYWIRTGGLEGSEKIRTRVSHEKKRRVGVA